MKLPTIALAALACLTLLGCRTDPSVTLLERQNRMLEDEVYRLREVVEDYRSGMHPTAPRRTAPLIEFGPSRRGPEALEGPVTQPSGPTFSESVEEPREPAAPRREAPAVPGAEQLAPPMIEFPDGGTFQRELPESLRSRQAPEDGSQEELLPVPSDEEDASADARWDRSVSAASLESADVEAECSVELCPPQTDSAKWVAKHPDPKRTESSERSIPRRRPVWSPER